MDADIGRVPSEPGSHEPSPAVSAASGFDPSRYEGLSWFWRDKVIAAILDRQEAENVPRPEFIPAISRDMVERAVCALLSIYDCRSSDFAAAYAWMRLWRTLGLDFEASNLVFRRDSDGSAERQDAGERLGPKDDSAGRKASPSQPIDIPSEPQP